MPPCSEKAEEPVLERLPSQNRQIPYFGGLWNEKALTPTACHHDCQVKHLRVERDSQGLTCQYVYRRKQTVLWHLARIRTPQQLMLKRVKSGTCCLQTEKKKGTTLSTELDRATSPRRTSPGLHTEEKHWMNLWGCGKITDFSFVSFSGQWIPYILRYYMVLLSHLFNICSSPWLTLTPYGHWIASHTLEVTSLTLGKVLYSKQFLALTLTSRQLL